LLMLPETSLQDTHQQAELLQQSIKQLNIIYQDYTLDSITISCGVASYPQDGMTRKSLLQEATRALHSAQEQTMFAGAAFS
ncbi:MAG: diguanylate cyclase, partial [Coleofasciculaceae cyanobacterium]